MWILDYSDDVPEGVGDGSDLDSSTDFMGGLDDRGADGFHVVDRIVDVRCSPPRDCTAGPGMLTIRIESELVSPHVEADVEWLVEVGLDAERFRVPFLSACEIGCGVDDRAKSEEETGVVHAAGPGDCENEDKYCS